MKELERNMRANRILKHPKYMECYAKIKECEQDRIFCRHDMVHFMDVARLAYLETLRWDYDIQAEYIYAAALLHDIGRHLQYLEGTPHEEASAPIAQLILEECGYSEEERKPIIEAILQHRNPEMKGQPTLAGVIYEADKCSRLCFACNATEDCHKKEEKKRLEL